MLTRTLLEFTLLGAEWVLWLLVGLSVASIGVMVERWWFYRRQRVDADALRMRLAELVGAGKVDEAVRELAGSESMESRVLRFALARRDQGARALELLLSGALARERLRYERRLGFLGTLGNNAPFIGLFGTVLGIIRAFADLAADTREGAQAVMAGISEALVATAVGLLVAIPAVIAYNVCRARVRRSVAHTELLGKTAIALLCGEQAREPAEKAAEAAEPAPAATAPARGRAALGGE